MMNKKRLLALLLAVVMVVGMIPTVMAADGEDNHIKLAKKVSDGTDSDYLLTLEAYVEGEASTVTKTKPADIVLVLDQSASMYAPMGASGGASNNSIYQPTANVKQYSEEDFKKLSEDDPSFLTNAAQLGYYVAQSHAGGTTYCVNKYYTKSTDHPNGHKGTGCSEDKGCKSYDWFIIQYVANDPKPWKMYRVCQTANPAHDSKVPIADDTKTNGYYLSREPAIVDGGFETLDAMIARSSFVFYKSQYGALYDAIYTFADGIVKANAGHRLAVTAFSAEIEYQQYATGSGIYVDGQYKRYNSNEYHSKESRTGFTTWQSIYDADTLSNDDYKRALMNASSSNRNNIMASIKAVSSNSYGTNHDVGMNIANKIFAQNPIADGEERDRIVILFTDGAPSPVNLTAYTKGYASDADGMRAAFIEQARIAKKEYGAQIYSIWTSTLSDGSSAFMRYGSSDYPDATSMSETGDPIAEPKYASGVKTGNDLLNAFGKVFEDVSSTTVTQLGEETIVRDVIAPSFTLPADLATAMEADTENEEELRTLIEKYIKVYESKYKGNGVFAQSGEEGYIEFVDAEISVTKDTSTGLYQVDVTNYDFSQNYVTDLDSGGCVGAKLVIQIAIDTKPDFLGGNGVVTNTSASAIYLNQDKVKEFPVPNVDVTVNAIDPVITAKDIYISQQASIPDVFRVGEYAQNGGDWKVDGINNAYVNIVYTVNIKDAPDSEAMTFTIPAGTTYDMMVSQWQPEDAETHPFLTEDTTYTVTCTVTPITDGTAKEATSPLKDQLIQVYKPMITFQDHCMNLGQTAIYEKSLYQVAWKNAKGESADTRVMGDAPTLEYAYTPEAGKFTSDTEVRVTVTSKKGSTVPTDKNITEYTTFWRKACKVEGCSWNKTDIVTQGGVNFVVHVNKFDLVIHKEGCQAIDENQSFVFEVTGPNGFAIEVTVVGNGSVTIKDLVPGTYTVKELEDWSWRYKAEDAKQTVNADQDVEELTFKNIREKDKWLSGDSRARNWWGELTGSNN